MKGTYEPRQTHAFLENFHAGDTVPDVGAHVGFCTALAARFTGDTGRVIAFEPRPINPRFLYPQLEISHPNQVTVIEACVGEKPGVVRFETRTGTCTGCSLPAHERSWKNVVGDAARERRQGDRRNSAKCFVSSG